MKDMQPLIRRMALVGTVLLLPAALAKNDGIARTPPMGWLSWQRYMCNTDCDEDSKQARWGGTDCINDKLYKSMADRLVEDGFREAGYNHVNIDDCWALRDRNADGDVVPNPKLFPNGISGLAKYMHDRGLKLGLYSDIGTLTCGGYPGMKGNYKRDAQLFASWGIDMLKVDGCHETPGPGMGADYIELSKQLNATGRQILYSCSWPCYINKHCEGDGDDDCLGKVANACHIWRNFDDIRDGWAEVSRTMQFFSRSKTDPFIKVSGPGAFHDPDMLMVGNPGLSISEQQAQFALWAIFASPLLLASDLRKISDESRKILLNREVIAVNQDPRGEMGYLAAGDKGLFTYTCFVAGTPKPLTYVRRLADGCAAVVLFNVCNLANFLPGTFKAEMAYWWAPGTVFDARDLYNHYEAFSGVDEFTELVDVSSSRMYKCCPRQPSAVTFV